MHYHINILKLQKFECLWCQGDPRHFIVNYLNPRPLQTCIATQRYWKVNFKNSLKLKYVYMPLKKNPHIVASFQNKTLMTSIKSSAASNQKLICICKSGIKKNIYFSRLMKIFNRYWQTSINRDYKFNFQIWLEQNISTKVINRTNSDMKKLLKQSISQQLFQCFYFFQCNCVHH